jgi:U3 small nucleolar RNA-associated protein 20
LNYLIYRLARILRQPPASSRAPALRPQSGAMQLLMSVCNTVDSSSLQDSLFTICSVAHHLTDPSVTHTSSNDDEFKSAFSALQDNARDLMRKLQERFDTGTYLAAMSKVKAMSREKREDRRVKRRIAAVSAPEKVALVKRRKREHAREKRKERNYDFRGKRRGW